MRYAFVAEHRQQFSVRTMCRCLHIHPSGFYSWLKSPLSKRAQEDIRQTQLIEEAWKQSGKVYGYRKLHDDLLDQGETSCANRIARLADWPGSRPRSAIGAGLVPMAASHRSWSTTAWPGSSTSMRRTPPG